MERIFYFPVHLPGVICKSWDLFEFEWKHKRPEKTGSGTISKLKEIVYQNIAILQNNVGYNKNHIKELHKLTREQMMKEFEANAFT